MAESSITRIIGSHFTAQRGANPSEDLFHEEVDRVASPTHLETPRLVRITMSAPRFGAGLHGIYFVHKVCYGSCFHGTVPDSQPEPTSNMDQGTGNLVALLSDPDEREKLGAINDLLVNSGQRGLELTDLSLIVASGSGAAFSRAPQGRVTGFKFGDLPSAQRVIELVVTFPYLQRLVFYPTTKERPVDIPPAIGTLKHLKFIEVGLNTRSLPEEIMQLHLPLILERPEGADSELSWARRAQRLVTQMLGELGEKAAARKRDAEILDVGFRPSELELWESLTDLEKEEIRDATMRSAGIFIYGSSIEDPPMEIIARGGDAVESYFRDRGAGSRRLNEVKVPC